MIVHVEPVYHHAIQSGDGAHLARNAVTEGQLADGTLHAADRRADRCEEIARRMQEWIDPTTARFEFQDQHTAHRMDTHIQWLDVAPRRKGEGEQCVSFDGVVGNHGTQAYRLLGVHQDIQRLAEETLGCHAKILLRILAHLQNRQVPESRRHQSAVRLDTTRRLHRLAVAVGQTGAMPLDAVDTIGPGQGRGVVARRCRHASAVCVSARACADDRGVSSSARIHALSVAYVAFAPATMSSWSSVRAA